jgi:DNA repair protein RadC
MNDNDVLTVCEIKVSYQPKIKPSQRPVMKCSKDLYQLFIDKVFDPETIELKESFKVALLNTGNKLLVYIICRKAVQARQPWILNSSCRRPY